MRTRVAILATIVVASASTAGHSAVHQVSAVYSPKQLGANDAIDWSQLGPIGSTLPGTSHVTSERGLGATVSAGTNPIVRHEEFSVGSDGEDEGDWLGAFPVGTQLIDDPAHGGITIDFAQPIQGAGAEFEGDSVRGAHFTTTIYANGGALGRESIAVGDGPDGLNTAPFFGVESDVPDITSLTFDTENFFGSYRRWAFAMGPLSINTGSPMTGGSGGGSGAGALPEPSSWTMMIMGFGLMGWVLRRERTDGRGSQPAMAA